MQTQLQRHGQILPVAMIFILVMAGFGLTTERFLSTTNIINVLRQSSPALVVGLAATLVIVAAGIDLSIGSMAALAGVVTAVLLREGLGPEITLLMVLSFGALVGLANGFFIAYQGIPSFIVTLAALSMLLGAAQLLGQGFSIPIAAAPWFINIGQGFLGPIPTPVFIAGTVTIIAWVVFSRTGYGLHLRGIGSNEEAVRRAGVRVKAVTTSVYVVSSLASAAAGIMIATRLQAGTSASARGMELQVIAAVVLGGTNLFGGRGTMLGTVLGVYTLAFINNGLILNHVTPFLVTIIQGFILLMALWINTRLFSRWL
jgi:simple sugar transport system permease protein